MFETNLNLNYFMIIIFKKLKDNASKSLRNSLNNCKKKRLKYGGLNTKNTKNRQMLIYSNK